MGKKIAANKPTVPAREFVACRYISASGKVEEIKSTLLRSLTAKNIAII